MDQPAAFEADYYNFEYKKGLKVCRLIFEVPYEHAGLVRNVLGDPPGPGDQVRVAIARLVTPPAEPLPAPKRGEAPEPSRSPKSRSQMAAILCGDPGFQAWLRETTQQAVWMDAAEYVGGDNSKTADIVFKWALGITSKKELDTPGPKAEAWDRLEASFRFREQVR